MSAVVSVEGIFVLNMRSISDGDLKVKVVAILTKGAHAKSALVKSLQNITKAAQLNQVLKEMTNDGTVTVSTTGTSGRPLTIISLTPQPSAI